MCFSACPKIYKFASINIQGMKGFKLFFAGCLGLLVFQATVVADNDDTVRAAVRRDATSTTSARQKSNAQIQNTKQNSRGGGRATASTATTVRERGAVKNPGRTSTTSTSPRATTVRTVSERNQTNNTVATRTPKNINATTTARTAARTAITGTRSGTTRTAAKSGTRKSRAATTIGVTGAISANYSNCRKIYYDCMDEFCANKDSQLRRCSCSARATEFNNAKKQMTRIEEKMLDFNQRLLSVNLDAEDVNAMMTSSEGEDAYYDTTDTTKSKKILDDISKRLNKTFGEDATTGMGAISLSLNADSVFDSIDSFSGIDTTSKNGTELYRAALPVCREMVLETCSEEELSLAESGYQMQIEQDCNTVSKSYQSQTEQARAKVLESSALLDMSRLDAHQKRNSDDILTCKKKMLDMLTDTTVCGEKMGKCLDITGQYVDPTTGKAFLTDELPNLSTLITRPSAGESWVKISTNKPFVKFLEDKKEYLKPAMEKCQAIADNVWTEFLPDALAQIKLAQDAKLEEVRQACTTLVSECLVDANESINNFDARALSVFGVAADFTVNTMCEKIKTACTNLLSDETATDATSNEWGAGITDITTTKTFETILSSCTQVGQNCFVQTCKSIDGNFGLCNDIYTSPNRHSILTRSACWDEVLQCVADAGDDSIRKIMTLKNKTQEQNNFYTDLNYHVPNQISENETVATRVESLCENACENNQNFDIVKCGKCRLAELIWGNCEDRPSYGNQPDNNATNYILKPYNNETLMYWFAKNTNTEFNEKSCTNMRCQSGAMYYPGNINSPTIGCTDIPDANNAYTSYDNNKRYCPTTHPQTTPAYSDSQDNEFWFTPGNLSYGSNPTNYNNIRFFKMEFGNNNTNCCWSQQTNREENDSINITTDPYNTGEMYFGNNACCQGRPYKIYNGTNLSRSQGTNICLPYYQWSLKQLVRSNNWYSNPMPNGNFMVVCIPENASGDAQNNFWCESSENPENCQISRNSTDNYPNGKKVTCHGTFIKISLTNGTYEYEKWGTNGSGAISGAKKWDVKTPSENFGMISYIEGQ